jgi:hypothetical protein
MGPGGRRLTGGNRDKVTLKGFDNLAVATAIKALDL